MAASYNVSSQLPQHIVDTYPNFVEFLSQYYAFLNDDGNPENILSNILKYGDIDTTIDSFREHILNELMGDIPNSILADRGLLAKHIKELYSKTGTEDSYRLLFRILFNKEIDIYYPGEQTIKLSNEVWKQNISFICHVPNTIPVDTVKMAISNKILVTIGTKKLPVYVYDVIQLNNAIAGQNIYEFFIKKDFHDNFNGASTFTINTVSSLTIVSGGSRYKDIDTISINSTDGGGSQATLATTNGAITSINLFNNGVGYINDPVITVDSENGIGAYIVPTVTTLYTGTILISPSTIKVLRSALDYQIGSAYSITDSSGIDLVIQVNELNADTTVKNFSIIQFGQYYPSKFYKVIDKKTTVAKMSCSLLNGVINNVTIDFIGKGYTVAPIISVIGDGFGAEVTVSVSGGGVVSPVIVNAGWGYTVPPALVLDGSSIVISGDNGKLRKYQGTYDKTIGTLSSDMAIYDGYYHQTFSYELIVNELFDDYKSVLKKLVHPTSYAVWSVYDLQNVSRARVNSFKIDVERASIISDIVTIAENSPIFNINTGLADNPVMVEGLSILFTLTPIIESPIVSDDSGFSINFSPATVSETIASTDDIPLFAVSSLLTDSTVSVEALEVDFVKDTIIEAATTTSDAIEFDVATGITEVATTSDAIDFDVAKGISDTVIDVEALETDFVKSAISETTSSSEVVTPTLIIYTTDELERGYWGGGNTSSNASNQIDGIIFSSETATNPSTALSVARMNLAGVSSVSHGYFSGGMLYDNSVVDVIDGIRFGIETALNPSATLSVARGSLTGANSSTRGYFIGGGDGVDQSNEIDGLIFATEAAFNPSATLATPRYLAQTASSSTKGYVFGGIAFDYVSAIEAIIFSTHTITSVAQTLSALGGNSGAVNSTTSAFIFGDYVASTTFVEEFAFSTETISSSFSNSSLQNRFSYCGVNSSVKGYIGGGTDATYNPTDNIQAIDFSTHAVTTPSANLATARDSFASVSTFA